MKKKVAKEFIQCFVNAYVEDGIFNVLNSGGGVEKELSESEVVKALEECNSSIAKLTDLILHEWYFGDSFGSIDEIEQDIYSM